MIGRKLRLRIFFSFGQANPGNENSVQLGYPGFPVCTFDVQRIDLAAAGPLAFAAVRAHQAADRTDNIVLSCLFAQIHHLMSGEIQQRTEGQGVQQRFLFFQRVRADHDARHAFHQLLPGAVSWHIQTEAAENGVIETGAVLVIQSRAPAIRVAQGGQCHLRQVGGR